MSKKVCCGMCINFNCGKCTIKDNKAVDCLDERCDDFKGFFDRGD